MLFLKYLGRYPWVNSTASEAESTVNCGGHTAVSCAACPEGHGAHWCNGECVWKNDQCTLKGEF